MDKQLPQRLSCSIEALRFPLILFIIFLHSYTSTSSIMGGHHLYFKMIYPFSLWIGETGVPAYFFISGLLLFYSKKTYQQKLRSRFNTLLIPYLFFNFVILCGYLVLVIMGMPAVILGKDVADYSLIDYVRAFWDRGSWSSGNGVPLLCPFWYIRNLIVLVILSPVLYYILKYMRLLFPLVVGFFWINAHDSAFTLQSLTMFSLGAYFPISGMNPMELFDRYKIFFIGAFVLLAVLDVLHLFISIPFALPVHRLALIANTFFVICLCGELLYRHQIYSSLLSKSAFFVFCIHYPFTLALKPLFERINGLPDAILILAYFASVTCIALVCVVLYKLMNLLMPRFLNVITGSRG